MIPTYKFYLDNFQDIKKILLMQYAVNAYQFFLSNYSALSF